jgi:hypothetical protein
MQFEIDDAKFMPPSIAEVICREILGIPISSSTTAHMSPLHTVIGKPKKPSKENPKAETVILVQFGAFRDAAVRLNESARVPVNKEKVMADTIKNLSAKNDRLQQESNKNAEALASALQFIQQLQCTR